MEIDGAIGGGSVLRVAVPLALATKNDIRVYNIRANRKKPGLRNQHILGLQLVSKLSGAELIGADVGSTEISLYVDKNKVETRPHLEISTAASISLILQIAINYSIASQSSLSFTFNGGGTYTNWSPNIDYCNIVQRSIFKKIGMDISIKIDKHGYFPKGGASGKIDINFIGINKFNLKKGNIQMLKVISTSANQLKTANVAERQLIGFEENYSGGIEKKIVYYDTSSPGSTISAFIIYDNGLSKGSSVNGERGLKAEVVGKKLTELVKMDIDSDAAVDRFMADQLLLALAMSRGSSYTIPGMSNHVSTNIEVIRLTTGITLKYREIKDIVELSH